MTGWRASVFISALALGLVVALCGVAWAKAEFRDRHDPVSTDSGLALQDDCVADLTLSGESTALIRYTISCAIRDADVLATIEPGVGQVFTRVSRRLAPMGPGAQGHARCMLDTDAIVCRAQRAGSVTFEGWLMVKPETRCRDRFTVSLGGSSHHLYPIGCPKATRLPLPSVAKIERFRREHGLDLDLNADNVAIEARATALRQALRDGDPAALVARRTWGVPLRDIDLRELEYRLHYNIEGSAVLREWFNNNASGTYAGHWIDEVAGGLIYVRFTGDQASQVAALRSAPSVLAPERIVGYDVPALHSMAELLALQKLISAEVWNLGSVGRLITRVGIDIQENRVVVGALDPGSVASALADRFGPEVPLSVVYKPRLSKKAREPKRARTGLLIPSSPVVPIYGISKSG